MKKCLHALVVLTACSASEEAKIRIAVRTDCQYRETGRQEYGVAKTYLLYNPNGSIDKELEVRNFVGAASPEYICSDDFAVKQSCSERTMREISEKHGGMETFCVRGEEFEL
ncbi:MAG: hypothetical protein LBT45_01950 [Rickettsiales bacterium]|jgi:hypothetical protein|nr:hypothetical protein [Rickettsiales bacterium]